MGIPSAVSLAIPGQIRPFSDSVTADDETDGAGIDAGPVSERPAAGR